MHTFIDIAIALFCIFFNIGMFAWMVFSKDTSWTSMKQLMIVQMEIQYTTWRWMLYHVACIAFGIWLTMYFDLVYAAWSIIIGYAISILQYLYFKRHPIAVAEE